MDFKIVLWHIVFSQFSVRSVFIESSQCLQNSFWKLSLFFFGILVFCKSPSLLKLFFSMWSICLSQLSFQKDLGMEKDKNRVLQINPQTQCATSDPMICCYSDKNWQLCSNFTSQRPSLLNISQAYSRFTIASIYLLLGSSITFNFCSISKGLLC